MNVFSYGGGVQSTAALVLSVAGRIPYPVFLFANTGDDSEHPETVRYVRDVAMPYAKAGGVELHEIRRTRRGGTAAPTLYQAVTEHPTEIAIPIRNQEGAPFRRGCTKHWKTVPIAQWTKARGATPDSPATIGLGISIDEWQRANMTSYFDWHVNVYPLLDLQLSRQDCVRIIQDAGLPLPRKSACWFCPFTRMSEWSRMKAEDPSLFMNAVVFERNIIAKRRQRGLPPAYLTGYGRTLDQLVGDQSLLDIDDTCESGHCMV